MNTFIKAAFSFVAAAIVGISSDAAAQQVPEIPAYNLPDAAMAQMTPSGPVIYYNPISCRAAGPACEFFRKHEYGHVLLGHLMNPQMMLTPQGRAVAEAQADCFAAQRSSPMAVRTMVALVLNQPPDPRDAIYGTKQQRAQRILACAGIR